jgi:hypothetical protein
MPAPTLCVADPTQPTVISGVAAHSTRSVPASIPTRSVGTRGKVKSQINGHNVRLYALLITKDDEPRGW